METLKTTEPHYIRCVKPNSLNRPQIFENQSVLQQLRCGGVLEAVRISLAGYPTRRTYSEFVDRFGLLSLELTDGSYDEKTLTERILKKIKLENFQLGRNKVFLRAGQIAILDSRRAEVLDNASKIIQSRFRTFIARKEFNLIRVTAITLQAYCRGCLSRSMYLFKKQEAAAVSIQKYARRWVCWHNYLQICSAVVLIQSSIRGLSTRVMVLQRKQHRAAILIQVSNDEAKSVEISKLKKAMELLNVELDAAKLATDSECNKNAFLQSQLEFSKKEKDALESRLTKMEEMSKENAVLKSSVETLKKEKMELEQELLATRKDCNQTLEKLQEAESKCLQLQQNLQSFEEKLSNCEDENHVLRQKSICGSPTGSLSGFFRPFSEKYSGALTVPNMDRKHLLDSPTASKILLSPRSLSPRSLSPRSISEPRRSHVTAERHQDNHEFLLRCIKEDLGFKDGKPVAACIIFKCLIHWHAFEAERTTIFDCIIAGINGVLKVIDTNLPYWLSNASALLCLLQRNLRANGLLSTPFRRSGGPSGLAGRMAQGVKSPLKHVGSEESVLLVEARYPAILFKQQLTACLEKTFGLIRDNMKKEISPLLSLCIQAPKATRAAAGKSSKSSGVVSQQSPTSHWDSIIKFLDSLLTHLRKNHVPSFFICKLITQVFSFINMQLFNSLLLRRECCTFSNGEYLKSGLAELERWIVNATDEFAGTSSHELNYIRQAVGFLVIHQKRKTSLEEIRQDLCPVLTVRQIYRISTMYWDDKYSTQSVSSEVVSQMKDILSKDSHIVSNSFLLDDDLSIPFSTDDISKAIPLQDPTDIELPSSLRDFPSAQFLIRQS